MFLSLTCSLKQEQTIKHIEIRGSKTQITMKMDY
jgi:hypothetical protein